MLAVYGTLRKGFRNHRLLSGSKLVWRGFAEIPYEMVVGGDCIPYLIPSEELHKVFLEVYEVPSDVLKTLDSFEDVPREYVRVRVYVHPIGFAWIYVARRLPENFEVVECGDYATYALSNPRCRHLVEG